MPCTGLDSGNYGMLTLNPTLVPQELHIEMTCKNKDNTSSSKQFLISDKRS